MDENEILAQKKKWLLERINTALQNGSSTLSNPEADSSVYTSTIESLMHWLSEAKEFVQ